VIDPIAVAEPVEPPAPLLEEAEHRVQGVEGTDAEPGIVAAARIGPAAVAVLAARGQRDDLGAPHRAAAAAQGDIEGKADLVKVGCHGGAP
jgi:hypothetical protein